MSELTRIVALSFAATRGHIGVAELLLKFRRVDADLKDQLCGTALTYATKAGNKAPINPPSTLKAQVSKMKGMTRLVHAAGAGHSLLY